MKSIPLFRHIAALLLLTPALAAAGETHGITFPDHLTIGAKSLTLNGVGLRQATFLKFNVYAGALYVETPSHDGEKIVTSPELKRVEMVFMRDVDAGKIAAAWAEGFEKNCAEDCEAQKPGIAKLQSLTVEMKKGEKAAFTFLPDHVEVVFKDQKSATLEGKSFSRNLLRLWIGKNPPNSGLKEGMLGIKD